MPNPADHQQVPMQVIRAQQVNLTDAERQIADSLYTLVTAPDLDTAAITGTFAQYPIENSNENIYKLYALLYDVERRISEWEKKSTTEWEARLHALKAAESTPDAVNINPMELQSEIDTCTRELQKRRMNALTQRRALYEPFFEYLHETFADTPDKIDDVLKTLQHNRPATSDPIHAQLSNPIGYYLEQKKKNVAYANPWYLIGMGGLISTIGLAFMITTLVTGLFAPYLAGFIFLLLAGLGIAWMGGTNAAQRAWTHRNTVGMETGLYSSEYLKSSAEYQKAHKSGMSYFTWDNTPILLLAVGLIVLIITDFYLGGPLSALGSVIEIALLPEFSANLPKHTGVDYFNNMTIITSGFLDMILIGMIGGLALKLIGILTTASDNKIFQRIHAALQHSYKSVFAAYSLCSVIATPFVTPLLPLIALPIAGMFFCYCLWQRVIKGQEKWVIDTPANPGVMGIGAAPASTMTINYNSGLFYSAMVITVCTVTAFALIANPITFGVSILLLAVVLGIAKDQILTNSHHHDKVKIQKHAGTELAALRQSPEQSPVLTLIQENKNKAAAKSATDLHARPAVDASPAGGKPKSSPHA